MIDLKNYINIDQQIQSGQPVFTGTRVTVQSLFWHLEKGITIEEFLEDFPSVTHKQVVGVLGIANKIVGSTQLNNLYEAVN